MARQLHLRPAREIPLIRGHPWIMSGAIARLDGDAQEDEADIIASNGAFIGRATVHPRSEIRARLFGTTRGEHLDAEGIRRRLATARERRQRWQPTPAPGGERLVFSESDALPGLIVDRYADTVVVQLLTAPWEARRDALVEGLVALCQPRTIWERSDVDVRRHEGLEPRKGLLWGEALTGPVPFDEEGAHFLADVEHGHKTGFYLDQRENRQRAAAWVRRLGAPRVLNVFAYTDAFGIGALAAGAAQVVSVDSSTGAADLARAQYDLNGGADETRWRYLIGDAFEALRALREAGETFDLVMLDPPRLVASKARLQNGLRAYKDINLLACQLIRPGGILITFSCSGLLDRELFGKVIEGAARDAKRQVQILESLGQPPDHPRRLGFPESDYLKGFVLGM